MKLNDRLNRFLMAEPRFGEGVHVARGAVIVGDVTLGDRCSVWHNAVLRGDINQIVVGEYTNIQDNAVLHLADDFPCQLGDFVTVGHGAIVHACRIGNESLIGMGAVVLDGAVVGNQCLIGARALVTQNVQIPDGSLVLGSPARVIRSLGPEERAKLKHSAEKYAEIAQFCLQEKVQNPV